MADTIGLAENKRTSCAARSIPDRKARGFSRKVRVRALSGWLLLGKARFWNYANSK